LAGPAARRPTTGSKQFGQPRQPRRRYKLKSEWAERAQAPPFNRRVPADRPQTALGCAQAPEACTDMNILVVDDQKEILMMLRDVLEGHGFEVLTADNGMDGLEIYRKHRPAFTLTDISMPSMNGLELLREIKALNSEASVILMTGAGTETYAIEALRGGAINYFNKPLDINDLVETLHRYSVLAAGYDFELYASSFFDTESLHLTLTNDLAEVNHAVQMIVNHCRAIFPLEDIYTLRFGLYEMIVNSIEHGNLGIGYEEKTEALEKNQLNKLIRDRANEPDRAKRRVRIECNLSREGMRCKIADEGNGFDHSVYSKAEDPALLFEELGTSLHGRGIMLTCLQFDKVEFNDTGNEVVIVKKVAKPQNALV
jgi:CheY-like chemotaxis protein/anti-sigma regulatory factor (Ser/Thr protein kinase)